MRSANTLRLITALMSLLAGLAMNGCSTYGTHELSAEAIEIPDQEDSADFLDRASEMELIDTDNALHGIFLLLEGEDTHGDFKSRVDTLSQKGIVVSDWTLSAGQPLTKGKLAYMVYQTCEIKEKGTVLRLLGPSRRYCLRELQYHGMMAEGNESMPVTGMEFVAVITRADTYKRSGQFPNEVGQPE